MFPRVTKEIWSEPHDRNVPLVCQEIMIFGHFSIRKSSLKLRLGRLETRLARLKTSLGRHEMSVPTLNITIGQTRPMGTSQTRNLSVEWVDQKPVGVHWVGCNSVWAYWKTETRPDRRPLCVDWLDCKPVCAHWEDWNSDWADWEIGNQWDQKLVRVEWGDWNPVRVYRAGWVHWVHWKRVR